MPYLQFKGIITHLSEVDSRPSRNGGTWDKQTVVVRVSGRNNTTHEIAALAEGRTVRVVETLKVGDPVTVSVFVSCHEWQGRYYNDISLSSIVPAEINDDETDKTATLPPAPAQKEEKKEDDLPWI